MPQFQSNNFQLEGREVLPTLTVAFEIYGSLNSDASNVILVAHGATSSHHAAGRVTPDRRMGWWDEVIGPGKLFDTEKYCIVSSNMLGSCYGTTGPSSVDPATGRRYGPRFPRITFPDIVTAQHLLLRSMGVKKLVAVAGSSLGGYQAFQWAVTYPDFMAGILALDTAPRDLFDSTTAAANLLDELSGHRNWNGGDYYGMGGLEDIMTDIRIRTLKSYSFEEQLKDVASPQAREAALRQVAEDWAKEFDANSLIALRRAMGTFNVERDLRRIRAKLLYILADSDEWFPASIGKNVMQKLKNFGVDAAFHELKSPYGHYATTEEPEKWTPIAARLLQNLEACQK
jgi:homoserine O-acetyltransferase/O-succinyltransferase